MPMHLIPDIAVFQKKLATLPLATYQADETVLSAASTTGQLLILKEGAVAIVKEGVEIARVTERGAVFGELSVLLDQPHTYVRWRPRSFTSPMRLPYSRATQSRSFTLQRSWRTVSTALIGASSS
jgi:CRP-like cAMP-binding protein